MRPAVVIVGLVCGAALVGGILGGLLAPRTSSSSATRAPTMWTAPSPAQPNTIVLWEGVTTTGDFWAANATLCERDAPCNNTAVPVTCSASLALYDFGVALGAPVNAEVRGAQGGLIAQNWTTFATQGTEVGIALHIYWSGCTAEGAVASDTCKGFTSQSGSGAYGAMYIHGMDGFYQGTSSCAGPMNVMCACYQPTVV